MTTIKVEPLHVVVRESSIKPGRVSYLATSWRVSVGGFIVAAIIRDPLDINACFISWHHRTSKVLEVEDQYKALHKVLYHNGVETYHCKRACNEWRTRQDYLVFDYEFENDERGVV